MADSSISVSVTADTTDAVESIQEVTEAVEELEAALERLQEQEFTPNLSVDVDSTSGQTYEVE